MPASRILIMTPGPLCRNPRPLKEAVALDRAGYEVTVITGFEDDAAAQMDFALVAETGVTLSPLRHPASLPGFVQRARTALARRAVHRLGWELPSSLGPGPALLARARHIGSDLVIAHNESALWAASQLHAAGRRVAADLEDWYSEDLLPAARRARPLRLLRALEATALHDFAYVSTTSIGLAEALHKAHGGQRAHVVPNTFPLQPLPPPTLNPVPGLLWFSQTVGPGRGLETFLAAWGRSRVPSRVVLVGQCAADYRLTLAASLHPDKVARLEFVDFVAAPLLPALLARHDLGLALEPHEPLNKEYTTSNKIYQYLNAGLAVLATPTTGQREVFDRAPDIGVLADLSNPIQAAAVLDALLTDRPRLLAHRQAARTAAERHFCWEINSPTLLAAVARALAS